MLEPTISALVVAPDGDEQEGIIKDTEKDPLVLWHFSTEIMPHFVSEFYLINTNFTFTDIDGHLPAIMNLPHPHNHKT